jgi:hypothetical protein
MKRIQNIPNNIHEILEFAGEEKFFLIDNKCIGVDRQDGHLKMKTPNGVVTIEMGDWIVLTNSGFDVKKV